MTVEIVGTPCVLNNVKAITYVDIRVGDFSDWAILPVGLDESVCNSFEGCSAPQYECLFTRLWVSLSFSNFEMAMMNHLKIFPSQLHPGDYAFILTFQLIVGYKSWKHSLGIFFDLFFMACTSLDGSRDQGLVSLSP